MAIVDVKLVTGFSVRIESLEEVRLHCNLPSVRGIKTKLFSLFQLSNHPTLNFKRYDIDGQNVQLYFDEV